MSISPAHLAFETSRQRPAAARNYYARWCLYVSSFTIFILDNVLLEILFVPRVQDSAMGLRRTVFPARTTYTYKCALCISIIMFILSLSVSNYVSFFSFSYLFTDIVLIVIINNICRRLLYTLTIVLVIIPF